MQNRSNFQTFKQLRQYLDHTNKCLEPNCSNPVDTIATIIHHLPHFAFFCYFVFKNSFLKFKIRNRFQWLTDWVAEWINTIKLFLLKLNCRKIMARFWWIVWYAQWIFKWTYLCYVLWIRTLWSWWCKVTDTNPLSA